MKKIYKKPRTKAVKFYTKSGLLDARINVNSDIVDGVGGNAKERYMESDDYDADGQEGCDGQWGILW